MEKLSTLLITIFVVVDKCRIIFKRVHYCSKNYIYNYIFFNNGHKGKLINTWMVDLREHVRVKGTIFLHEKAVFGACFRWNMLRLSLNQIYVAVYCLPLFSLVISLSSTPHSHQVLIEINYFNGLKIQENFKKKKLKEFLDRTQISRTNIVQL